MKALALQEGLRAMLCGAPGVVALVPPANIIDTGRNPPPSPSIVLGGEVSRPDDGNLARDRSEHFHDLHIWTAEAATVEVKRIAGEVQRALLLQPRPVLSGGYQLVDWHSWRVRIMREADGSACHAVVTVRAIVAGGP